MLSSYAIVRLINLVVLELFLHKELNSVVYYWMRMKVIAFMVAFKTI